MIEKNDAASYLHIVLQKLSRRLQEVDASLLEGQKEITSMQEYYWQNYTEMDQYGYEDYDNQQALLRQVNANEEQLLLRNRFRKMMDSPFFGRVDFVYEGEEEPETFYIGIANFAERPGETPLIYDWRSPVCSLFYDYDRGPASYEAPAGTLSGEILSKWQYKIRHGKLVYSFESDIKIDDEILKRELGSNSDIQLKNIIRTIQKEQNAIIRNTKDRILVIQGAAGSGKTSVALHRIAYLLYHDRESLKSSNLLILTPNGVFADYISHILPELGEENIQEMSFDLFAYRELLDTVPDTEDRYDQIERELKNPASASSFHHKQSRKFVEELEEYLLFLEDDLMIFSDVSYQGFVKKESEIIRLFYGQFAGLPLFSRMEAVAETFLDEIETLKNRDLSEEERLLVIDKFTRMYETRDLYVLYSRFLARKGYHSLPHRPYDGRSLRYEDVYPVLYLKYRLSGSKSQKKIKHLVIDEMQDYSYLQYRILQLMFTCRMTILGDRAQTLSDKIQDVTTFLPEIFGRDVRIMDMKKSYRNTVEIASYANQICPVPDIEFFERHGKPVEEKQADSLAEVLDSLCRTLAQGEDSFETAALILPCERLARAAFQDLKKRLSKTGFDAETNLSLLTRDSTGFQKGLIVTTFYLAKGLEFDQVFAAFPDGDTRPLLTQARYVSATRALHELTVYQVHHLE